MCRPVQVVSGPPSFRVSMMVAGHSGGRRGVAAHVGLGKQALREPMAPPAGRSMVSLT
jgi:hypothetical protein